MGNDGPNSLWFIVAAFMYCVVLISVRNYLESSMGNSGSGSNINARGSFGE
ncbi:hypothetical protein PanWU01x14_371050, partial [Parasponia andersonii]